MKVYNRFEEVKNEIKELTPLVIYKFRNWGDSWHKKIISDRELWFAHPHSLNDPYDVRPPYNFIVGDIDLEIARNKIKAAGRSLEPNLSNIELEVEVEKRLQEIKQDPEKYFRKSRSEYVMDSSLYDNVGILSCCSSFENEPMWAYYGNNHCGFAIGFKTVELAIALNCSVGFVEYNDSPIDYYIMGNNEGLITAEIFKKSTKWKAEEEIRFVTVGIGIYRPRANVFPIDAAKEIIFGLNTSKEVQDDIIKTASGILPGIPFYKIEVKADSFGFKKVQI